jgi:hypothetical protein
MSRTMIVCEKHLGTALRDGDALDITQIGKNPALRCDLPDENSGQTFTINGIEFVPYRCSDNLFYVTWGKE